MKDKIQLYLGDALPLVEAGVNASGRTPSHLIRQQIQLSYLYKELLSNVHFAVDNPKIRELLAEIKQLEHEPKQSKS